MHPIVKSVFSNFTAKFEGSINHMYLDVLGLVTVARGNLIDPITMALGLPFERGGVRVSRDEIAAEWRTVKARQDLAKVGARSFKSITSLRLSTKGINDLVISKLLETEAYLKKRFPEFDTWPADAQLGVLSMAWAMGAGFKFKTFEAAVLKRDFAAAAAACKMNETGNPGLIPRNAANKLLFLNAARVLESPEAYKIETLYWPDRLPDVPVRKEPDHIDVTFVDEVPQVDSGDAVTNPRLDIVVPEDTGVVKSPGLLDLVMGFFKFLLSLLGKK